MFSAERQFSIGKSNFFNFFKFVENGFRTTAATDDIDILVVLLHMWVPEMSDVDPFFGMKQEKV